LAASSWPCSDSDPPLHWPFQGILIAEAAGATPEEVEGYAAKLAEKIAALSKAVG
jgi:hypothetical protein